MNIKRRQVDIGQEAWPNYSPLIQRLYMARGLKYADAQIELKNLLPYHDLLNIEKAVERLVRAMQLQQHILVIGDFDADGATASALAVSALRTMGAMHVDFLVPNRFMFGYGLTVGIVEQAYQLKPDLIITVDNGISNIEGVERAKSLGIDVLITDHHLAGEILPQADVIINPNQPLDQFKSKAIAGVGVVFYVMSALRRALEGQGWFEQNQLTSPNMAQFLDLVALGTVADVVPLDKNNRIMVKHGLHRIQSGMARPGIQALIHIANRKPSNLKASDLGFALAPRLNAAGRLDDMSLGINCLLSTSFDEALPMASQLDLLNIERREIESQMQKQALEDLQKAYGMLQSTETTYPKAICLYQASWHQGVIGILAGRIKDKFKKPTIIFAQGSEDELKGSARSVQGINIRDVLAAIDLKYPDLIIKFGGHAMAAGLAIKQMNFVKFEQVFNDEINILGFEVENEIHSDGELPAKEISLATVNMLLNAGPWGQQFPEPLFDNIFKIIEQRIVGQQHLKLILQPLSEDKLIDAIAFNINVDKWPNHRAKYVHVIFNMDINEYQGRQKVQLLIHSMDYVDEAVLAKHDLYALGD